VAAQVERRRDKKDTRPIYAIRPLPDRVQVMGCLMANTCEGTTPLQFEAAVVTLLLFRGDPFTRAAINANSSIRHQLCA
jgi:hypothetical protein